MILELSKGDINPAKLSECQQNALSGVYAEAMSGFLQWMAGRYEELVAEFKRKVIELRTHAMSGSTHARTPEIVASLQVAFDIYLEFAESLWCD